MTKTTPTTTPITSIEAELELLVGESSEFEGVSSLGGVVGGVVGGVTTAAIEIGEVYEGAIVVDAKVRDGETNDGFPSISAESATKELLYRARNAVRLIEGAMDVGRKKEKERKSKVR